MRYTFIVYKKIKVPDSYQPKPKPPKSYIAAMLLLGVGGYAASALWNRTTPVPVPSSTATQVDQDAEASRLSVRSAGPNSPGRGLASVETNADLSRQKNGASVKSGGDSNSEGGNQSSSQTSSSLGLSGNNPKSNSLDRASRDLPSYANKIPGNGSTKKPDSLADSNSPASGGAPGVPLVGNMPSTPLTAYNHSSDGTMYPGQSNTRTQGLLLNRNFGILTSGGGLAKSAQIQIVSQLGNSIAPNFTKSSQLQVHSGITAFNE